MAEATSHKSEPARRRAGVVAPWAFCLLSPCLCLLPAGCAPDDFAGNDPLIGGPPVRPPSGAAVGPAQPQPIAGVMPPLPQAGGTGTPAALTGAGRGTLDPSRDLRIGGADAGAPAWQPSAGGGAGGVALQAPQPVTGPVSLQPKAAPDVQLTGGPAAPTYEQLMAELQKHGVGRLVIVPDGNDVTWSCVVPAEAGKQKHCDVRNPRDPVAALQALLAQLEQK